MININAAGSVSPVFGDVAGAVTEATFNSTTANGESVADSIVTAPLVAAFGTRISQDFDFSK